MKPTQMKWKQYKVERPKKAGFYLCYTQFDAAPSVMYYRNTGALDWSYTYDEKKIHEAAQSAISNVDIEKILNESGAKLSNQQKQKIVDGISDAIESACTEKAGIDDDDALDPEYWCEMPEMLFYSDVDDVQMECYSVSAQVADIVASQVASALSYALDKNKGAPWSNK